MNDHARASAARDRRNQTMNNEAALLAAAEADRESDVGSPSVWALGDYHAFAKATIWALGAVLARACGISAGQRVLDVAAGTGNTAIRAAEAGCRCGGL
jgi:predicted nicotinamide N-methyase